MIDYDDFIIEEDGELFLEVVSASGHPVKLATHDVEYLLKLMKEAQ